MRRLWGAGFVSFVAIAVSACSSPGRQAAWEVEKPQDVAQTQTSTGAKASLEQQANEHWTKRDDKQELMKAISILEGIVASDPRNADALLKLSRAYYFLADGHISLEPGQHDQEELEIYEKGSSYAEKALVVTQPAFEEAMKGGADFKDAIVKIDEKGIPAAYWYCANIGRFARKKGLSARIYYKDRLKSAIERVRELKPDYFYAGADRFLGAFYAALPSIAGKDLKKSEQHFMASLKHAPQYLTTKVLQADTLAVDLDDRKQYEELLKAVIAAPDTEDPDIAPENRAAKRTAQKLLAQADDKF